MKRIVSLLLIVLLAVGIFAYMQYSKPAAVEVEGGAELQVRATELFAAYEADESAANERFLGKNVAVTGVVSEIAEATIHLDTGDPMVVVLCGFATGTDLSGLQPGDQVLIQGACDGFSGFDVQFSKCKIVEQ